MNSDPINMQIPPCRLGQGLSLYFQKAPRLLMLPALIPCFTNQSLEQPFGGLCGSEIPFFLILASTAVLRFSKPIGSMTPFPGNLSPSCLTLRIGKAIEIPCFKGNTLLLGLFLLLVLKLCVHVYMWVHISVCGSQREPLGMFLRRHPPFLFGDRLSHWLAGYDVPQIHLSPSH